MELDVVNLDSSVCRLLCNGGCCVRATCSSLHEEFVVDAELALRHTREERLDTDSAEDICLEDGASRRQEHVDALDDVDEDLITLVADSFSAPRDGTCGLNCDGFESFEVGRLLLLSSSTDVLFQEVGVEQLWIAIVAHLIQQLVNQ